MARGVGAISGSTIKGTVVGRRSIFWSTRDWTMEELTEVELNHGNSSSQRGDEGE